MNKINIEDLGVIDYESAWKMQDEYALEIAAGKRPPTLLLLEHPHVYTFGRKGSAENLLWGEERLKQKGISTHWVDRGGDITYHGPGQLVGYPLLSLGKISADEKIPQADYVGYIRNIENMLIATLMRFGIASGQRAGKTGVWVQADVHSRCIRCKPEDKKQPAKIAAIGVKVDAQGISRHGFALNVNPNMEYWEGIIPCGINEPVASLEDLIDPFPEMSKVKEAVSEEFLARFQIS